MAPKSKDPSGLSRLVGELKRRRVFRVVAAYAVVAFVLIEAADMVFPALLLPDWALRLLVVVVLAGFPLALALAWAFDLTPQGVVRTPRRSRPAEPSTPRRPVGRAGQFAGAGAVAVLALAGGAWWALGG
ncbi:MAG: hypothetical protein HY701_10515, partial [Gemmatimonadetes bacterium]|nr:hypothetical protein [Gemmatimonadota bacterium]